MGKGVFRSLTIALLTAMVALSGEATYVLLFCSRHQAWLRVHAGRDGVVLNHQYGVRRAGEAVFACESIHHAGPLPLHEDLTYYCAPSSTDPNLIGSRKGGTCAIMENDQVSRSQYCDDHVDSDAMSSTIATITRK
jgi:hypothetical protein